jgi:hypothetical protein
MAAAFYNTGLNAFGNGDIDWSADTIRAYLIDAGQYTFSQSHDFLDDVAAGARIAFTALANKSVSGGGQLNADDFTLTNVSGASCEAVIYVKWTGSDATSQLIMYHDGYTGLPVTPNGGSITVDLSSGYVGKI